jgi:hypothetical protein
MKTGWTAGPPEPNRIRPEVVEEIIWVFEHGLEDIDAADRSVLLSASDAEFDAALTTAVLRAESARAQIEAVQAEIQRRIFGDVPDDASELDQPPGT